VLWTGESGSGLLSGLITTLRAVGAGVALAGRSESCRVAPHREFRPLRALATFYVEFSATCPCWFGCSSGTRCAASPARDDPRVAAGPRARILVRRARPRRLQRRAVFRGAALGIQSIPKTQAEAAVASGLTTFHPTATHPARGVENHHSKPGPASRQLLRTPRWPDDQRRELTFQTRQIETYTAMAIEALAAGSSSIWLSASA